MKKKFATLCTVLLATILVVGWQQQPTYNLKLTENEIQVVLGGLSKLPYEQSAGVIQKIIAQAQDTTLQKTRR